MGKALKALAAVGVAIGLTITAAFPAFAYQTSYQSKSCGARLVTVTATATINTTHIYVGTTPAGNPYSWNSFFATGGTRTSYSGMANGTWSVLYSTSYSGGSAACYSL